MRKKIRVLVADDHPTIAEGLSLFFRATDEIEVAGIAVDGLEAIHKARSLKPDVIVLDMLMPFRDGPAVIKEIRQDDPDARILVFSAFADDDRVLTAIRAGALGYLLKGAAPSEIVQAVRAVYRGESFLPPLIARKLIREFAPSRETPLQALTERELEVLSLVARGFNNREVAESLLISERTVRTHVSNILDKLDVANRTQATLYALRNGLVRLEQRL